MHHYGEYKRLYFSGFTVKKGSLQLLQDATRVLFSFYKFVGSGLGLPSRLVYAFEVYAIHVGCFQFVFHGRSMYTDEKSTNMLYIIHSSTLATEVWKRSCALFRGRRAHWNITIPFQKIFSAYFQLSGKVRMHWKKTLDFFLLYCMFTCLLYELLTMYPKMHPSTSTLLSQAL